MKELKAGEPFQGRMLLHGVLFPEAILKATTLSASARLLWGMLAESQGKRVECSPLEETLAVALGVKVRQLQSYIKELANYTRGDPPEPFPLIAVKRVWVEKEGKTRNTYNLLWQPFLAVDRKANGAEEPQLVDGGDTQSSARLSEGDAQDAATVRPATPTEDAGAALGAMPLATRNPLRIGPRPTRKILLMDGLPFRVKAAARSGKTCHPAIRNLRRIGPATLRTLPRAGLEFPVKMAARYQTACRLATRNHLRIAPGTSRKELLPRGPQSPVKTAARYRTTSKHSAICTRTPS